MTILFKTAGVVVLLAPLVNAFLFSSSPDRGPLHLIDNTLSRFVANHAAPHHVAIIPDGNGRWAQQKGLPRIAGHAAGAHRTREVTCLS